MTIKTKIIVVLALTVSLTVGATTAVVIEMQKSNAASVGIQETGLLCDVIEKTAESTMVKGRPVDIQEIFDGLDKDKEITKLRILSPDGRVLKSINRSEIGSRPSGLPAAAFTSSPAEHSFLRNTVIDYFRSIPNRKQCFSCHGSREKTLGIIEIARDSSGNYADFRSFERTLIFFCLAIVLVVSAAMSSLFSRLVIKPLKGLLSAMRDVEEGNWNAAVNVGGNDEVGEIGTSFNKMITEVNRLYERNIVKERELSKVRVELEHKKKVEELNSQLESNIKKLESANEAVSALSEEVTHKNIALERAVDRLKKINQAGRMLSSIVDTRELTRIILQTAAGLLDAEKVTMHLKNTAGSAETMQYVGGKGIVQVSGSSAELEQDYPDLFSRAEAFFIPGQCNKEDRGEEKSMLGVPLIVKGHVVGAMILENNSGGCSFTEDDMGVLSTLSNQAVVAVENAWLYESLKNNYFATIQSLVNALEASDRFTKGHSERVRLLSVALGKRLGLSFRELELLEQAAILHDIGKIGIDNFVLQKQGKLTSREYGLVKTHPLIGDEILGPIENLEGVRKTIIQHHERYDGTGYPYGLRGEEITLKSRILSVVDTFDAMMTDRPYRKALDVTHVKNELRTNAGTQFDPRMVGVFIEMLETEGDRILSEAGYNALFSI